MNAVEKARTKRFMHACSASLALIVAAGNASHLPGYGHFPLESFTASYFSTCLTQSAGLSEAAAQQHPPCRRTQLHRKFYCFGHCLQGKLGPTPNSTPPPPAPPRLLIHAAPQGLQNPPLSFDSGNPSLLCRFPSSFARSWFRSDGQNKKGLGRPGYRIYRFGGPPTL